MEECRICFEGGNLISPCHCQGSMKYVHYSCLLRWRIESPLFKSLIICDQCLQPYSFTESTDYKKRFRIATVVVNLICIGIEFFTYGGISALCTLFRWTRFQTIFLAVIVGIGSLKSIVYTNMIALPVVIALVFHPNVLATWGIAWYIYSIYHRMKRKSRILDFIVAMTERHKKLGCYKH